MEIDSKSITPEQFSAIHIAFVDAKDDKEEDSVDTSPEDNKADIAKVLEDGFLALSTSIYGEDMDSLLSRIAPCKSLLMLARAPESNAPVRTLQRIREVEAKIVEVEAAAVKYRTINVSGIVANMTQEFVEVEDFI